ncbi:ribonuclease H [Halorubrum californiense DSM 19288]|uniref:Ribonuclease H n=1 Tax=Halorubrum californiense DSM 19288 TaxID=1227465 RepID=M0E2U4_9EURY|nr:MULTISPECIES: ribonuclease HI family protein [Halorubrum]ELZ42115.1 ribonuclease H [Halorubrum californiense DSM 19288]TKX65870.1 ribonuclease HI family protein [Halorubrum sp. GN11GM_10-3_MGM]
MDRLPTERLSPLASRVDDVLALYGYEMRPAIDAIDAAVTGYGGLFDPTTTDAEIRTAVEEVLAADPPPASDDPRAAAGDAVVLYVDGSSRGNPGPAGAGAVLLVDDDPLLQLGRPVGTSAENNTAEYAALHLGLEAVAARCDPAAVEVRIDSRTVIDDVWGDGDGVAAAAPYRPAIRERLGALPACEWTHLADSDPNPADARAAVGADIAALGP